jgi:nucleotide-binding universal stress UspA family protein
MAQKILIPFDDSENAMRAVSYVGRAFAKDSQVTLFHVLQDTAALCELYSPELTDQFVDQQSQFCVLEAKKKQIMEAAMATAKGALIESGFRENQIDTVIEMKKSGVARDILARSSTGYDTVVMGRRGLSGIREFFLGSVSQKVFHAAKNVTVVVVN